MKTIKNYLGLVTFAHTIFAFPFALIGFFLGCLDAGFIRGIAPVSRFTPQELYYAPTTMQEMVIRFVFVVLCMVFARSAAMAFNRYLDAAWDAKNPRTAIREIPSGKISKKNALIFTIINAVAFVLSAWFINPVCFYLSPIALFVILFYSYTKRFTALCHLVLGLGLSLAPIGAYLAVTGVFSLIPVLFSISVICWVSGFDIIYALQDEEFDREHQLNSIPVKFGKAGALRVSELLHIVSALSLAVAGYLGNFGTAYWIGFVLYSAMLIYQHYIVSPNDLRRVNRAFMTANGFASLAFAIFVIADIFLSRAG